MRTQDAFAKTIIRSSIRNQRLAMDPDLVRQMSLKIQANLRTWIETEQFDAIAGYFSVGNEPDIAAVMTGPGRKNHGWYFPVVTGKTEMHFSSWCPDEALRSGKFGIPEPASGSSLVREGHRILFLVPCLAVDQAGSRLGSGGGYYDRYLSQLPDTCNPFIVAVCFDQFIQKKPLPTEPFDVPVHAILSEAGLQLTRRP